jgi:hypothetical protein
MLLLKVALSLDPLRFLGQAEKQHEKGPPSRQNGVAQTPIRPNQKGTFSMPSLHSPDGLVVGLDDEHAVANAGLVLPATLAQRLGIEQVVDQLVDLGDAPARTDLAARCSRCCTPWWPAPTALTTPTCSAPGPPPRCWATGCWRHRHWARSCARSPSATSASSTGPPSRSLPGRGRLVPARVMGR